MSSFYCFILVHLEIIIRTFFIGLFSFLVDIVNVVGCKDYSSESLEFMLLIRDVIRLMNLNWGDYPELSRWALNAVTDVPIKREEERYLTQRKAMQSL